MVFSYLYGAKINWESKGLVPILATAMLFQFKELIDKCVDIMKETLDNKNVASFYNVATSYGLVSVKSFTKKWLEANIMSPKIRNDHDFLRQITPELFESLLRSPDLTPPTSEYIVYDTLKHW